MGGNTLAQGQSSNKVSATPGVDGNIPDPDNAPSQPAHARLASTSADCASGKGDLCADAGEAWS